MFWGDRAGNLMDPFGYQWMIATHKRDMTKDQIKKEAEVFFAQMAKKIMSIRFQKSICKLWFENVALPDL
jgi:hypothetical protein